jgi:ketosteroid isomerase-like protein
MKKRITIGLIFISILACHPPKIDTKAEGEKVMQTSREWSEVTSTRNLEKTLSYWAENAVIISPGQPVLKGKKEIRRMIE